MKYSIIIPTYDNLGDLEECMFSIFRNSTMADTEIIVVSNGCEDHTVSAVSGSFKFLEEFEKSGMSRGEYREHVKILSFPDPVGYPKAINLGLSVARGKYVVLLNNDCVILDHWDKDKWLECLSKPLESDASVGISGITKLFSKE